MIQTSQQIAERAHREATEAAERERLGRDAAATLSRPEPSQAAALLTARAAALGLPQPPG